MKPNVHLRSVVPGGAGGAHAPQILADQLTLSQPGGADYAHHKDTGTLGFSDLPTALHLLLLLLLRIFNFQKNLRKVQVNVFQNTYSCIN